MPDLIGHTLINRYRVDAFIDRGGMADVYRGFDQQRQIHVALKFLRSDLAEDPEFERRFRKEANALQRLTHPGIVRFYELDRTERMLFLVMDFVDGSTLRGHLFDLQGPLSPAEVLGILTPIAAALNYAHAQGVLHRDIKPGNIMLAKDGRALLTDFGIAKFTDSSTITTVMAGTPAYMSPEQCAGRALDSRSDLYSLGVLAYEMLAGRRPFVGETPGTQGITTAERIRSEHLSVPPPSALSLKPQLPPQVDEVLARVLAKRPQERHAGTLEFLQALRQALPGVAESKPTVRAPSVAAAPAPSARPAAAPARRRGFIWMVGALAVVAAVVFFFTGQPALTLPATATNDATAAVVAVVATTVVPPTESPAQLATETPVIVDATPNATVTAIAGSSGNEGTDPYCLYSVREGDTLAWIAADSLGLIRQRVSHDRIQKQIAKIIRDNGVLEDQILTVAQVLKIYWQNEYYPLAEEGAGNLDGELH